MTAEQELADIRSLCEKQLTANPDDSTFDLVRRLAWLAAPEAAGRVWFIHWQRAVRVLREHGIEPPPIPANPPDPEAPIPTEWVGGDDVRS